MKFIFRLFKSPGLNQPMHYSRINRYENYTSGFKKDYLGGIFNVRDETLVSARKLGRFFLKRGMTIHFHGGMVYPRPGGRHSAQPTFGRRGVKMFAGAGVLGLACIVGCFYKRGA